MEVKHDAPNQRLNVGLSDTLKTGGGLLNANQQVDRVLICVSEFGNRHRLECPVRLCRPIDFSHDLLSASGIGSPPANPRRQILDLAITQPASGVTRRHLQIAVFVSHRLQQQTGAGIARDDCRPCFSAPRPAGT